MNKTVEENQAFVKAVIEVVHEAGEDYVFNGVCRYFNDGEPACLFGRAISKVGIPASEFMAMRNDLGHDYNSTGAAKVLRVLGYDSLIAEAADEAQRIQDGRTSNALRGTWGKALSAFLYSLRDSELFSQTSTMD